MNARVIQFPGEPDYLVSNHGTIFLVEPQNSGAADNLLDNVQDDAQWFGHSLAVEHRYIGNLIDELHAEGWVIR